MISSLGSIKIKNEIWTATFLLNAKYLILKYLNNRKYFKICKQQIEFVFEIHARY
jgi:hypothetical protein